MDEPTPDSNVQHPSRMASQRIESAAQTVPPYDTVSVKSLNERFGRTFRPGQPTGSLSAMMGVGSVAAVRAPAVCVGSVSASRALRVIHDRDMSSPRFGRTSGYLITRIFRASEISSEAKR